MATKTSEARLKANARYDKSNTVSMSLKFNIKNDSDILTKLHTVDNKQKYIKTLIRNDIKNT